MKVQSEHVCVTHKVRHEFEYDAEPKEFAQSWHAWKRGTYIQEAFPAMTADQREILMTGTCQEAWDKMFPPDED